MEEYKLNTKKRFENFVEINPKYLDSIAKDILGKDLLDFSEEEIRQVSQHYIDLYSHNRFDEFEHWHFYSYYGHAFMNRFGGNWKLSTLKDHAYLQPIVINHIGKGLAFYPLSWIQPTFVNCNSNQFNEFYNSKVEHNLKTERIFSELLSKNPKKKK
jgi:hypothetical protein